MIDFETVWGVDYLSLMSKPENTPSHSRELKRMAYEHYWYDYTHISFCREHFTEYFEGIEKRNQLARRVSKMHKAYRQKKRGW